MHTRRAHTPPCVSQDRRRPYFCLEMWGGSRAKLRRSTGRGETGGSETEIGSGRMGMQKKNKKHGTRGNAKIRRRGSTGEQRWGEILPWQDQQRGLLFIAEGLPEVVFTRCPSRSGFISDSLEVDACADTCEAEISQISAVYEENRKRGKREVLRSHQQACL